MPTARSDIRINRDVYLSAQHRKNGSANILAQHVVDALPIFRKYLNFSDMVIVRVANIKKRGVTGRFWSNDWLVEVEPTKDVLKFLSTLAHELVHAEQYHEGRLQVGVFNRRLQKLWHGNAVTRTSYRNLPWEKEAFARQDELAKKVFEEMFGRSVDSNMPHTAMNNRKIFV